MRRKFVIATTIASLSIASMAVPTFAAGTQAVCEPLNSNKAYLLSNVQNLDELKQKLEEMGIECPNLDQLEQWFPGCTLPDAGTPDQPDVDQPDGELPDTDQPDEELPDTELPDTDQPDNSVPEQPETPDTEEGNQALAYAERVLQLVNQERAKAGLAALAMDEKVSKAALVRAKETEISFSHTRPDGSSFSTALKEQGVSFRGAGENIAWGQRTPEEVMNGWMNSSGHRANILNKNYTTIGIGYYQNSNGTGYWTQLFTY